MNQNNGNHHRRRHQFVAQTKEVIITKLLLFAGRVAPLFGLT